MHDFHLGILKDLEIETIKELMEQGECQDSNNYFICGLCLDCEADENVSENKLVLDHHHPFYLGLCYTCSDRLKKQLVFCPEIVNLKKQVDCVQSSIEAHAVGVANVYNQIDKYHKSMEAIEDATKLVDRLKILTDETERLRGIYEKSIKEFEIEVERKEGKDNGEIIVTCWHVR